MREILFRGKQRLAGGWCEGFLVKTGDHFRISTRNDMISFGVVPETVGQYTGLKDRNGKRIFEGDIISADNTRQHCVAVVKFGEYYPDMFYKMLQFLTAGKQKLPACGFFAESVDRHEEMILFKSPCVTVIGNIHDNPELLEGGANDG